jgi:diphosphomevalonate decarboxylase
MSSQLLAPFRSSSAESFSSCWQSPSNIAFVKYWGKKGHQLPANPSLSMSLSECHTRTQSVFSPSEGLSVTLKLEGKERPDFALKIAQYLTSLSEELPWLKNLSVSIESSNTFPHGTGIASSASGLSAFALTLTDYFYKMFHINHDELFFQRASYLSRLASGSACRSVFGGFSTWGECHLAGSSDLFASPLEVHSNFQHLMDSVLVLSSSEKAVSSRSGHGRMESHHFAQARFEQAKRNFERTVSALKAGDLSEVGALLEAEALALHAMMLTSPEPYILFEPNTILAMKAIWAFRKETGLPLYFTLDAGPNLHLIYPDVHHHKIQTFIGHELSALCETIIHDRLGKGPHRCL